MSPRPMGGVKIPVNPTGAFLRDDGEWAAPQAGEGATVKSGLVNLGANGSANVSFVTPFANVPQVVVTSQFSSADTSTTLSVHSVTVNGFTLRGAGNAAGSVAWLACDGGNS